MEPVNLNQIRNTMQNGSRIREQAARQIKPETDNAAETYARCFVSAANTGRTKGGGSKNIMITAV